MKIALIGSGGHAREVMMQMGKELPCFLSSEFYKGDRNTLLLENFDPEKWEVMIAIGDPIQRKKILDILPVETRFFTFIHETCMIGKDVEIGQGSFLGAYSILTTNIKIGNHSILNRSCHIGHDSFCGDVLSMMPGSILSGNVNIGDRFYIGTNSAVREKTSICDDVKVGLCSSVIKDITESGTYVGCPVKKIEL